MLFKSSGGFAVEPTQRDAWLAQIKILKNVLSKADGSIYFEYAIPRMGKRIDVVLLIGAVIFVLEFKVGETEFTSYALNQAWDYALDLKNFHETSRKSFIAPIVIATNARSTTPIISATAMNRTLVTVPVERVENAILLIRGEKVMLDRDLAALYDLPTKVLKQAVRRNLDRFPDDFMFVLDKKEFAAWRSQFVTSKSDRKGLRYPPMPSPNKALQC